MARVHQKKKLYHRIQSCHCPPGKSSEDWPVNILLRSEGSLIACSRGRAGWLAPSALALGKGEA